MFVASIEPILAYISHAVLYLEYIVTLNVLQFCIMTKLSTFVIALAVAAGSVEAFTTLPSAGCSIQKMAAFSRQVRVFEEKEGGAVAEESVFMAPGDDEIDEDMMFEKAELLGRGSSKVCVGFLFVCERVFV